jgi:hypothetical protein
MVLLFIEKLEKYAISLSSEVIGVKLPSELSKHYSSVLDTYNLDSGILKVYARIHVSRVFNDKGEIVKEIGETIESSVKASFVGFVTDLVSLHRRHGIPIGYFLELLLLAFIIKRDSTRTEISVYPNEFRHAISFWAPYNVKVLVENYVDTLKKVKVGELFETINLLDSTGLHDLGSDLLEGLRRFYNGDYEGSIKFFRKVVEGLRDIVKQTNVFEGHRKDFLNQYLSKAYQLISNFGEHIGTRGYMYEAELSRDIAVSASRYVARYLQAAQKN